MGLMLSVLIECVGVLEVIACYQHLSYGLQHALDEPKPELSKIKQNLRKELIESDKQISLSELSQDVEVSEVFTSSDKTETHSQLITEKNENIVTDENVYKTVNSVVTNRLDNSISASSNIENKSCSVDFKDDTVNVQSDRFESKSLNEIVHEKTQSTNEIEIIDENVSTEITYSDDKNSKLIKSTDQEDLDKIVKKSEESEKSEQHDTNVSKSESLIEIHQNENLDVANRQSEQLQEKYEIVDSNQESSEPDKTFIVESSDTPGLSENIDIISNNNDAVNERAVEEIVSVESYIEEISHIPSSNIERVSENEIPFSNVISGPFESIEEVAVLREVEVLAAQETRSSETLEGIESIPLAEEAVNDIQEEQIESVNNEDNVNERESVSTIPTNGHTRVVNGIGELRGHFQIIPEPDTSQSDPNVQAEYVVDVVLPQTEDHHDHNDVGSISNEFGIVVYDLPVFRSTDTRVVPNEYSEEQTTDEISELSMFTETDLTNSGPEVGMMPTTLYYHPETGSLIEIIHEDFDGIAGDVYSYDVNPDNPEIDERLTHACLYNPDSVFYRPPSPFPDVEISLTRNELKIPESLYETDSNKSMDEELADKPKGKRVSFQDYVQTEEYEKDSLEDEPIIENQNVETILGQLNVEEIENEDSVNLTRDDRGLIDNDRIQAGGVISTTDEIIAVLKGMTSQEMLVDDSRREMCTETEDLAEVDNVFERETSPLYVEPYVLENVEESVKERNQHLSYDFLTQASEEVIFDIVDTKKENEDQNITTAKSEETLLESVTEIDASNISLMPNTAEENRSKSPTSHINIQQSQTNNLSDDLHTKSNQITLSSINAVSLESQLSRGDSELSEFDTGIVVQNSISIQNKQLDECILSEESLSDQIHMNSNSEPVIESAEISNVSSNAELLTVESKEQSEDLVEEKIKETAPVEVLDQTQNNNEESVPNEESVIEQIQSDLKQPAQLESVVASEPIEENIASEITDEIIDENVHFVDNIIQSSREGVIKRYKQDQNNEIKRFDSEPILPQRDDDLDDITQYNQDFLNSLDGIKMNTLSRDSGSWRRKNFRNRRSLSSNSSKSSSKTSRDEELKMLTSLEETEQGVTYETMKQNISTDSKLEPESTTVSEEKTTPHRRRRKHRSGKGKQAEKDNSIQPELQNATEIDCNQRVVSNIDIISEETVINDDNSKDAADKSADSDISNLQSEVSVNVPISSSDILNDDEALERIEIEQAHASYEKRKQMRTLSKIASFEDASVGQHQEILPKSLSLKKDDSKNTEESTTGASSLQRASPQNDNTKNENKPDAENSSASTPEERSNRSSSQAFWLIFSGEYTKAMNKDWHGTHFCCWQCDESLTGQRYVLRDDHPYCVACYESVFANGCEECNKIIGIDSKDLSYKDKHWHEACFLCTKCRVSLVDKQFGSKLDKIYCGNCYDAQFASRCDGCGEIFRAGTKKMEYKTRQWHEKCFCCCVCKTAIGTKSFIPREQEIYCAQCYEEKFATRCVKCNKIITSGGVTYKNEPWHRECFTCSNCNTSLAGQRFTSRDEKPYCADCFGELFAKRCTACSKPITGIGGTRFISFEERHWHNDCFVCATCRTSLVGRGFITDEQDIICPDCAKAKLM